MILLQADGRKCLKMQKMSPILWNMRCAHISKTFIIISLGFFCVIYSVQFSAGYMFYLLLRSFKQWMVKSQPLG